MKNIFKFGGNRFLNSMGVPTKDLQKFLAIKGAFDKAKEGIGNFFVSPAGAAEKHRTMITEGF